MAQTYAFSAPVQPVLQRVSWSNETLPNASKHYETHTNMSPMGWIGCVRCEKFWCDIMARTSALIAPVQHVLHRVSCSNETLPNAPKYYEMHQNMSLRSNGVDRVRSLRKIPMRIRGPNFCTSSLRFAPRLVRQPNSPKCTKMVRNSRKHEFRVQWGGLGEFVAKNSNAKSWHKLLH